MKGADINRQSTPSGASKQQRLIPIDPIQTSLNCLFSAFPEGLPIGINHCWFPHRVRLPHFINLVQSSPHSHCKTSCERRPQLQQFRRAAGVAIVRGNAKHKLGSLHYVSESAKAATNASAARHSADKWNPSHNGHASRYNVHAPNGYETYLRFRNGFFLGLHLGWMRWIVHSYSYFYLSVYSMICLDTNLPKSPYMP
jgi:hypothetical protein